MERREFLKSSCNVCLMLTAGLILPMLPGCGPAAYQVIHTEVRNDLIEIPLSSFTQQSPLQLVRPNGWLYAIAVRKKEDSTYSALLLKCTHQDNQLTASANSFNCSLHGSAFNTEGAVTKGPAEKHLKQYTVSADQTNLTIHLKAS